LEEGRESGGGGCHGGGNGEDKRLEEGMEGGE
jgi:hypothetical protein